MGVPIDDRILIGCHMLRLQNHKFSNFSYIKPDNVYTCYAPFNWLNYIYTPSTPLNNYEFPHRMPESKDIYMLSVRMLHSFNDEFGVCIFPRKLDQSLKSQTPMYTFNILLSFNVMVRIVESTRDSCAIRQKS